MSQPCRVLKTNGMWDWATGVGPWSRVTALCRSVLVRDDASPKPRSTIARNPLTDTEAPYVANAPFVHVPCANPQGITMMNKSSRRAYMMPRSLDAFRHRRYRKLKGFWNGVWGLMLLSWSSSAKAEQATSYLSLGPIVGPSYQPGVGGEWALGAEATLNFREPNRDLIEGWGYGIVGHYQALLGRATRSRGMLGGQVFLGVVGVEGGVFAEQGDGTRGTTLGLHLAPFACIGFLGLGLRLGIPLAGLDGPARGVDLGAVLYAKIHIPLNGELLDIHFR